MEYALLIGESLLLPQHELDIIEYAAILHDIGKVGINDRILSKHCSLNSKEWEVMREHSLIGANIIKDISFLEEARKLVLHHHERYDGTGYPDCLKGENIPIGARVLAVADAFDTMTTKRSYRDAISIDHAMEELKQCSGSQFCPICVEAFCSGYQA